MILLDNNVLTRLTNDGHPNCRTARHAVHKILTDSDRLVLCPQAIYEFWAVATRTKPNNGLGLSEISSRPVDRVFPPTIPFRFRSTRSR